MTRLRTKGERPMRAGAGASWRGKGTTLSRGVGEIKGEFGWMRADRARAIQELGSVLRFFRMGNGGAQKLRVSRWRRKNETCRDVSGRGERSIILCETNGSEE